MSLNKVMLIGNLGQDPKVKYLENNRVVAHFSIATNEYFTGKDGQKKIETEWHQIEVWDNLARNIDQLAISGKFGKGIQVYVEGRIKSENYRDKSGIEHQRKIIKANQIQLLGTHKSQEEKQ
ncbi:MAG: single-stranded DNA-binding protein [Sphingobacteriales bacterium]|jgi:single-strand DNA-binding protein|nr:single-stranded DNA-binding protein [Sphingobacteriales bacterium]